MTAWEGLTPPYRTIVADPPWRGYGTSPNPKADPSKQYATLTSEDVRSLPVADLAADDAHLWLWVCNWSMADGMEIAAAWGFRPITIVTWCKPGPGVGYYFRTNTEHCIFATRGAPMVPTEKPLSSWFLWPRGKHSAKPAAFGDLVEQVSPGPYVELFARAPRLGWDSWGHGYEMGATG